MKQYLIHIGLFFITFCTTLLVGAELVSGKVFFTYGFEIDPDFVLSFSDLSIGLPYAIAFLAFLSFHEFGHYFTAVYHKVKSSLPYYIPLYIPFVLNIGSLGAVIRLKEMPESTRKYFDIGIAGPLAGFVVSVFLLVYGFANLPDKTTYILELHPDYQEKFGGVPDEAMMRAYLASLPVMEGDSVVEPSFPVYFVGANLLMEWLADVVPTDPEQVPPPFEIMHYPFLFVGYITLFFTALNLLPIGQLDGGHITYGMFGRRISGYIGRISIIALLFFGGTGFVDLTEFRANVFSMLLYIVFLVFISSHVLYERALSKTLALALTIFCIQLGLKWIFPETLPNLIWLLYAFIVVRLIGIDHPPARLEHRVDQPRQLLGWLAILIFVLCFTPNPIWVEGY